MGSVTQKEIAKMENENENENKNENERERDAFLRGTSLEGDFRTLITDEQLSERFSDISLRCSDNVVVRSYKNILVARSNVFNKLILNAPRRDSPNPRRDSNSTPNPRKDNNSIDFTDIKI